jgi:hypothetical protein
MVAIGPRMRRAPMAMAATPAANLDRYTNWRGRDTSVDAGGPTGADEMRALMRQRVILWGALVVAGVVLVVAGLLSL